MASIVSHVAKLFRSGLNVVNQTQGSIAPHARGDNLSILGQWMKDSHQKLNLTYCMKRSLYSWSSGSTFKQPTVNALIRNRALLPTTSTSVIPARSKVYISRNGKMKTVHAVVRRFYRLQWGAWIRTRAGRQKKLWKKSEGRKYRLRQHVFCNKTQNKLLDKMTTKYWRKPRYFVDDPYAPYQKRSNMPEYFPEKKPFYP